MSQHVKVNVRHSIVIDVLYVLSSMIRYLDHTFGDVGTYRSELLLVAVDT